MVLARAGAVSDPRWVQSYCQALAAAAAPKPGLQLWFLALPFCAALAVSCLPWASRLLPVFIALRGVVLGYCLTLFYLASLPVSRYWLRITVLLPLFYLLCQTLWLKIILRGSSYDSNLGRI